MTVNLGCNCVSSLGWSEEINALTPQEAVVIAINITPTCCRCRSVTAECEGFSKYKNDNEAGSSTRNSFIIKGR